MNDVLGGQALELLITDLAGAFAWAICLAFVIETSLGYLFGMRRIKSRLEGKGAKGIISLAICFAVAHAAGFDFFQMAFQTDKLPWLTLFLTAAFLAGGSRSISLRFGELKRTLKEAAK